MLRMWSEGGGRDRNWLLYVEAWLPEDYLPLSTAEKGGS